MEIKTRKWEPGREPMHPTQEGMTQKKGLTIRDHFSILFASSMIKIIDKANPASDEIVADLAVQFADTLIERLYPEPVAKPLPGKVDEERSACSHDGEVLFLNGSFQCMKCKNKVDPAVIQARVKK